MATLQVRRFEVDRNSYEEYYAAMYARHIMFDDPLSALCDVVADCVGGTTGEPMPGRSDSLLGLGCQDIKPGRR